MVLLLFGSLTGHAQVQVPGCPPGVVPGQPGCGGDDGSNSSAQTYTGPIWQDRYGAIALDSKTGSIGWASVARSKRAAAKEAIEDCGGGGCKIQAQVRNSCLATAWGGGKSGFGANVDLRKAEEESVNNCEQISGTACKVEYSACSLSVRIR
ncbi:DUF4189 domain-containing protein [Solilutibacter silvestris]|uniref:DUF4189 domain-containing protein n=1 Tax=Solilutibacter silvestris TaxID=1645665 RepID=UPI003CCDF4D7